MFHLPCWIFLRIHHYIALLYLCGDLDDWVDISFWFPIQQKYYIICISFSCRCEIKIIEDDTFQGLNHLSTLILTGNPIQSLAWGAFSGLSSLRKLVAVETNLVSLHDFPIGHLRALKELNVAHNFIHSFKLPEYFSNLPNLEHLDLSNNKIQNISHKDVKVLHQMPLLNLSLDLSLNPLGFIEPGTFKEIKLN